MASPVVLIGTGTSIGKTHVAERVLRAAGSLGARALGFKPVESGITPESVGTDFDRLEAASSFHVKPMLRIGLREPVSPHLAARAEGVTLDVTAILAEVARLAKLVDLLIVELPGGAFSPFTEMHLGIDVARAIPGASVVLVAPDRLGVLHDVGAASRACAAERVSLEGLVLNAATESDASTGRNASELPLVTSLPLLATIARGPGDAPVCEDDPALPLARRLLNHR